MKQIPAKIPPHRREDIQKSFYLVKPNAQRSKVQFIAEFLILDGAAEPLKKALKLQSKTPGTVIYEGWHGGRDLSHMYLVETESSGWYVFNAKLAVTLAEVKDHPESYVAHALKRFAVGVEFANEEFK